MKKLLLLSGLILLAGYLSAQDFYTLVFRSKDAIGKKVLVGNFYGERIGLVDSVMADAGGKAVFQFSGTRASGMYRFILNRNTHTDFIFNKENIEINADYSAADKQPEIIRSKENKIYYEYLNKDQDLKKRIDLLMPLLDYYPKTDPFYDKVFKKAVELQEEQKSLVSDLIKKNPDSYAVRMIRFKQLPAYDLKLSNETEKKTAFRDNFLKVTAFNDTALIRSNVYATRVIDYLSLYANPNLEQKALEKEFIKAVDVILGQTVMDPKVYDFVLSYLVGGFEKFKFEDVLVHISGKYLAGQQCENDKMKQGLAMRIESYEKMAVGKTAPDFSLKTSTGKIITNDSVNKSRLLLVFWASWCPHCAAMLPDIAKLTAGIPKEQLQVVTVSLDTAKTAWTDFIARNMGNLVNCCDLQGWNGKCTVDYHIYATPTMFLLDRQRKILSKPISLSDLKDALQEEGIIN